MCGCMSKSFAHWVKKIEASEQPAYLLLPELIAQDVRNGRLVARDKLPTLRDLASLLGLNYTTVARAYSEARKRGLIDTHAGLGTFVRGMSTTQPLRGGSGAEMTMNMPPEPQDPALMAHLQDSAARLLSRADWWGLLRYQDFGGTHQDRDVGAQWLRARVADCKAEQVLLSPGIHCVLTALFSFLARPGELVCVESLTYPGVKAIAAQLGLQLHALPMDDEGPLVDAFEHACKSLHPKALYCNPTLLNPTTVTMSRARREALADVALRFAVPIIEDDAYGMLPQQTPPSLANLAPELTYHVSGLSKCFGAGLRSAYVRAPSERQAQRLAGAMRATTVMSSPVTNALTTAWVQDGTAQAMLQAVREECAVRQRMAATHLQGHPILAPQDAFHLWLPLSPDWSPVEFASYLRTRGAGVVASAAFSTDGDPPDAVRVCLGGPVSRDECDQALRLIADTLNHPVHPHSTV